MKGPPIDRRFQAAFDQASLFYPVVIVTGARQVGKSTFVRLQKKEFGQVSLDLPSLASMAEEEPGTFFERYPLPLAIDEAQYAPGMFRHIKWMVDQGAIGKGDLVLTGSQKFTLMSNVGDSLAGRCAWLEMEGFSIDEIRASGFTINTKQNVLYAMHRGQMPMLWREPDLPSSLFWSSYTATYLERDVRQILNVQSLRDFERFMRLLALRNGQLLNRADLARDTGISVKAAADWISVLERSNVIELLEPYHSNVGKRVTKSPKVYFLDTGLACFLLGLDEHALALSPLLGSMFECFALGELRKANRLRSTPCRMYFYRDESGTEVDLVLEQGDSLDLVEVKWGENPGERHMEPMNRLEKLLNAQTRPRLGRKICITPDGEPHRVLAKNKLLSPMQVRPLLEGFSWGTNQPT